MALLSAVKKLTSHAGLHRNSERTLKFATRLRHGDISGDGDDDLLRAVVVSSSFALVFGFLNGSFLVTFVEVADDVSIELLNFLFKWREALDSNLRWLTRLNLKFVTYLEEFMRAEKG